MGSIMSKIDELEEEKQIQKNQEWLRHLSFKIVTEINPYGEQFENRKWMEKNAEKIVRNRALIDLIG